MSSGYQLGETVNDVATIESLGIKPPQASTFTYPARIDLGDGSQRNLGFPQVEWRWGYITQDAYDALQVFCPDASAPVVIVTRLNDGTFGAFSAQMLWPATEDRAAAGRRLDFTLRFRQLVSVTLP